MLKPVPVNLLALSIEALSEETLKTSVGLVVGILIALPSAANVSDFLERQTAEFLKAELGGERLEVQVRPLDSRLKLAECQQAWDFSLKAESRGSAMVVARCDSRQVHLSATYDRMVDVVLASRPLKRGDIISTQDLVVGSVSENRLRGNGFTEPADLIGMAVKRSIRSDQTITERMVEMPTLVERGDTVKIIAGAGPLQISVLGEALRDGVYGDSVSVKNLSSGRTIRGKVVGEGVIELP